MGPEVGDGLSSAVAHARPESADQLVEEVSECTAIRYASFDPFGDQFFRLSFTFFVGERLSIAFAGSLDHGSEGAHAAILFEGSALVQNDLSWTFVHPCQQSPQHHAMCPSCQGFGDIPAISNPPVGDNRDVGSFHGFGGIGDSRELWNADTRNNSRRTNRSGSDPDLDGVCTRVGESFCSFSGGDVARDHVDGPAFFDFADRVDDVFGVTVSRIDDEDIDPFFEESGSAIVIADANCCPDPESSAFVFRGEREPEVFVDVLDRD